MNDEEIAFASDDQLIAEYQKNLHGVQTGIATKIGLQQERGIRYADVEPKHLRVGVNSAMMNDSALLQLLIDKGIITRREHLEALVKAAQNERKMFERELTDVYGFKVHLA